MDQAKRIVARYIAAAKMRDEDYQQTPQYKTGPRLKGYYPQKAPPGLSTPPEVNKLPPLLRKWFDGMPEKDLDSNRGGYTNPGFKAAYKELLSLLLRGALDDKELKDQFELVDDLKNDLVEKQMAAKTDEAGEPYRFAMRKMLGLWRVYNGITQSDDWKKIDEKHDKLRIKKNMPYGAKPTTSPTPRGGKRITQKDVASVKEGDRVKFIIGEGDDMFEATGVVRSNDGDALMVGTSSSDRTVWTFSDAPGASRAQPLSRIVLI